MAIDLGNAYVQIIPSAQGIKGQITEALGGESEQAGKQSGESIAKGIVSTLKNALIAAGIGTIIKSALDEGAKIQQSFGGLDTIYGDASASLKNYAKEAAAAGISANDYAEQAVSFGAALKAAYGGDTVKAAEAANAAIMAVADNSAKMGTDIGSVTAAFQGFAKGQYTLLDNLKIGYGGTKSEMERLLKDAEAFSGVKYDINNLGDVYTAIGVIQEKLGLAGVAADEAKTTFSGSFGAMQAAATNFLASLTTGEGVTQALNMLMETVITFVTGNLFPMLGTLLSSLPSVFSTAIQTGIPMLQEAVSGVFAQLQGTFTAEGIASAATTVGGLISGFMEKAPDVITAGGEIIKNLYDGMGQNLPSIIEQGGNTLNGYLDSILSGLPAILDAGTEFINNLSNGVSGNMPTIISAAGETAAQFLTTILNNLPAILESGVQLLQAIANGLIQTIPVLLEAGVDTIAQLAATFLDHLPEILQCGIELIGQLIAGIIEKTPEVLTEAAKLISDLVDKFLSYDWGSLGRRIIEGIAQGLANAGGLLIEAGKNAAKAAFDSACDFLKIKSPSQLFRDEVGAMMAEGMAIGFEENVPTAEIEGALRPMADVVPDAMGGSAYNYGGFSINVYQAPGQSSEELVDLIETRINQRIQSKQAVFA